MKFHYWITTGRPELKWKISHFRPKTSLSWSQVCLLILNRKLLWFTILNCIWEAASKFQHLNLFPFKLILLKCFKVKALEICFFKERSWKSFGLPYFPQLLHHWGITHEHESLIPLLVSLLVISMNRICILFPTLTMGKEWLEHRQSGTGLFDACISLQELNVVVFDYW